MFLQSSTVAEPSPQVCAPARKPISKSSRRLPTSTPPLVTVIIINYNGEPWLERCLGSLREQTVFNQLEIVVADNASTDQSAGLADRLMKDWPAGRTLRHGGNLGYSEGNNRAAERARGRYLLFLNHDTWLEPNCIERLIEEARQAGASLATPLVMDYLDGKVQSTGGGGFDVFGLSSGTLKPSRRQELLVANGCALLIESEWFRRLGGFDPLFFMYADEADLCWRAWVAGAKIILARSARMHHRGAVAVNPLGGEQVLESRTTDSKRFYANRNNLLVLLKNSQHLLLLIVPLQLSLLFVEAMVMWVLTRRWSHVHRAYIEALSDCWRLRRHIRAERRRLRGLRQHGDFWMLRFLRARLNRWPEVRRCRRFGPPKVDPS
jgi:GT2 family glycosyltransferase